MRTYFAILIGKIIASLTRSFNIGGGFAAPGLYALRVDPPLIKHLSSKIPLNIIVTGTNGKTTTARLLAHFAKTENLRIIRNHTGSNLERGIASSLIQNSSLHLKGVSLNYDVGIWEVDEAAFNTLATKINSNIVIFLNVFRDQLDRYGEVDTLVKKWTETIAKLPEDCTVILNADDRNLQILRKHFTGKIISFGLQTYQMKSEIASNIANLPEMIPNFQAIDIKLQGLDGTIFKVTEKKQRINVQFPIPGTYHIYDFLAAFVAGKIIHVNSQKMISSLKNFSPAFGRVEKFELTPSRLQAKQHGYVFLIKNPAGATQVFSTIAPQLKQRDHLLLALNDNFADGTDVSWIWDAEFEKLLLSSQPQGDRSGKIARCETKVVVSGTRAYDLAIRLKYAGFPANQIQVQPELDKAFLQAQEGLGGTLFVLPTYTAMLELQTIMVKQGIKQHYWKEDKI